MSWVAIFNSGMPAAHGLERAQRHWLSGGFKCGLGVGHEAEPRHVWRAGRRMRTSGIFGAEHASDWGVDLCRMSTLRVVYARRNFGQKVDAQESAAKVGDGNGISFESERGTSVAGRKDVRRRFEQAGAIASRDHQIVWTCYGDA